MDENLPDDELLRSYLLGDLPEEEADRLEKRLLADDELFLLAEAVEADLLAAASRGELTPAERKRALRRLASSPQGRERFAMAQTLNAVAVAAAEQVPAVVVPIRPVQRRHTAQWMALAASLLLITGLGWFAVEYGKEATKAPTRVAGPTPKSVPPLVQPATTPAETERAVEETPKPASDQIAQREKPQREKPQVPEPVRLPEPNPAVLQFAVLSGARGGEKTKTLDLQEATVAEIQIDIRELGGSPPFRVTVRDLAQGMMVFEDDISPRPLNWENEQVSALVIEIPAERLSAGRYEVSVTSELEPTPQTEEFEVVREGTDG